MDALRARQWLSRWRSNPIVRRVVPVLAALVASNRIFSNSKPSLMHSSSVAIPMRAMKLTAMVAALRSQIDSGTPFLGICLGLQALYENSDEAPDRAGFGLLPGRVKRFEGVFKIPHLGWNQLEIRSRNGLFEGVPNGSFAYFCHSYYGPVTAETTAVTEYGQNFAVAVRVGSVYAVQFHPEKSGDVGLKILENFLKS